MTKIEWTNQTWNPVTGCDRVSPGCDNCYALTMSARLKAMGQPKYQTDGRPETSGPGFGVQTHPDTLDEPLRWRKPRRVFVNSMSDLFHPEVAQDFIAQVFGVMAATPQHTYQILTKRPARMRSLLKREDIALHVAEQADMAGLAGWDDLMRMSWPLPNVWLGVSVEDQDRADQRVPLLLDTPAAVRFVSAEPLLGPVDLHPRPPDQQHLCIRCGHGPDAPHDHPDGYRTRGIDWVIVGGESGPHARPMHPEWARQVRDQCQRAGVAFFFKQWGSWAPYFGPRGGRTVLDVQDPQGQVLRRARGHGGRELDGETWDQYPDTAEVPA